MFVGHAALAFAVVARLFARSVERREALVIGAVAAVFATIPDVDMLYAPVGLVGARLDALALASAFWSTSTLVHRGVTHSLVVASVVAVVALVWFVGVRSVRPPLRWGVSVTALGLGSALVVAVGLDTGALGGFVTVLFVGSALLATTVVARRTDLGPVPFCVAAAFGLLSHPFGDVFTGTPPAVLYPLDVVVFPARVALAGDPTLHLLAAGALELLTIWLAASVLVSDETRIRDLVSPRVALAAGYAVSVFLIPPPTLDLSYPFVLSVVSVAAVGAVPRLELRGHRRVSTLDRPTALFTALAAVTVAWGAYAVAYLVV